MDIETLKNFEVGRLVNLMKARGYVINSQGFGNSLSKVQIERVMAGADQSVLKNEADMVRVLVKTLGWTQTGEEYFPNRIVLSLEKEIKGEIS